MLDEAILICLAIPKIGYIAEILKDRFYMSKETFGLKTKTNNSIIKKREKI